MKFRPIGEHVLLRAEPMKEATESGLFIPENSRDRSYRGVVVAVGTGVELRKKPAKRPLLVKEGDEVIFSMYAGEKVDVEGEELLVVEEDEIYAVFEK